MEQPPDTNLAPRPPVLDARSARELYAQALVLARHYFPQWADQWPAPPDVFPNADPGLVVTRQFSVLADYLVHQLNLVPEKYRLAFYQTLGLRERLPVPARAFLVFTPGADVTDAVVPAGSEVASSDDPELLFTTGAALDVLNLRVVRLLSVDPATGSYADHSADAGGARGAFPLLGGDTVPLDHALFLGDDVLLAVDHPVRYVDVEIEGANLSRPYFAVWMDAYGRYLSSEVLVETEETNRLTIRLTGVSPLPRATVAGVTAHWIQARPAAGVPITEVTLPELPQVSRIQAAVAADGIGPDAAFADETPLEVKNGFYPFGEMPARDDAFYLASREVFAKTGAAVALDVVLAQPLPDADAVLAWEYWNGQAWQAFAVVDTTNAFTRSGTIRFTCPDVRLAELNGVENRWIRARITAGGYGHDGEYVVAKDAAEVIGSLSALSPYLKAQVVAELEQQGIVFGYTFDPATYTPPFVLALTIGYTFADTLTDNGVTYNAFRYAFFRPGTRPFVPPPAAVPTFYVGVSMLGLPAMLAGRAVALYVAVQPEAAEVVGEAPAVRWSYYDGAGWQPLEVVDGTEGLRTGGVVRFALPADWRPAVLFEPPPVPPPADEEAAEAEADEAAAEASGAAAVLPPYWLRVEAAACRGRFTPVAAGVFPNAVLAANYVDVADEVLGSSNGTLDQTMFFAQMPVLAEQVVEVREPVFASVEDLQGLEAAGQARVVRDAGGRIVEVWVVWQEVDDFIRSDTTSRHYVLDHEAGVLRFGNGVRGMVPPRGVDNVVARRYRAGGGTRGNVAAGRLTTLFDEAPGVETVTNPLPGFGGAGADRLDAFVRLSPYGVRSGGRAVTASDFADLAVVASPEVVRADCYGAPAGRIRVALLVDTADGGARPVPRLPLMQEVAAYLKARALLSVQGRVEVVPPIYVAIDASVRVVLKPGADAARAVQAVRAALARYLDPLRGDEGRGWPFAATLFVAQAVRYLEQSAVPGLAYVASVALEGQTEGSVQLVAGQLPTPGAVEVGVAYLPPGARSYGGV